MGHNGNLGPNGAVALQVTRADIQLESGWPSRVLSLREIGELGMTQRGLSPEVNTWRRANRPNLARGIRTIMAARLFHVPHFYGQLFLTKFTAMGEEVQLGLAGMRMVTTAGVRFIADDFNTGTTEVTNMKFHGFGTGAVAEAVGNTALATEVTNTTYVGDVRPTGTQASATVTNDATYTTVATYSPDSGTPIAVTEHGIFSASAAGTLLDKTLFAVVTLATGDSLQATYVLTLVAGG